jgi:ribonuclease HI
MQEKYIVYTDGGSRSNPGPAGLGVYITDGAGNKVKEVSHFLGVQTNNFAEYEAVVQALKALKQILGSKSKTASIVFKMDSELIVRQLTGIYQIKEVSLIPQFIKVHNALVKDFKNVRFEHIPREENTKADALANAAMDRGS